MQTIQAYEFEGPPEFGVVIAVKRACLRCRGEGTTFSKGFSFEGKTYPDRTEVCRACNGAGYFEPLDVEGIIAGCFSTRGKKTFRKSCNGSEAFGDAHKARVYYVWRLTRFHGGEDMRMPMTADLTVRGDPFRKELDNIADILARKVFGSNMAAARRWGQAFGII